MFMQDWGQDKLNRAQKQLKENQYDLETWSMLIREAQLRWVNDVRPFFEKLVSTFPSSGRYWKIYIEQEVRKRKLHSLFILSSLLWSFFKPDTACLNKKRQNFPFSLPSPF